MYLQSLELFGFKSFASKTKMEFHRGVTAVVGPNGCGKSNVLDAMRWVLGEQSAKALRGGEMADVIFSGTDSRAAVGMAEVSMTFAECEEQLGLDWHEVTITRRVFRDGGSDYLLNKTPCRLRDIHQMFMDTGIGRSAYSIMEQGKIDMILSSRPEDRRAIFEEAAGITKYKSQKKEALRKLEATEANLLRLADIIKEVKRQIGSLQRQAGKARRYQVLLADLRLLETHSAKRQFDELSEQRAAADRALARLRDQQAESEAQIDRQETEVSLQRVALEEMEQRLNASRQVVGDLKQRVASHENRVVFNRERAAEFAQLVERYRTDVAGAEEKLRVATTQLRDTDAELAEITTLLAGELRSMEAKQAATASLVQQRQNAERTISALASDAARIDSRMSGLRGQVSSVVQQRDGAEARLGILATEIEQLTFGFSKVSEQLAGATTELDRAAAQLETQMAALAAAENQLRNAQSGLGGIESELRGAQRTLAEKESRIEVLRQLNEGGEGFSEGTQAVLRGLDNPTFFKPAIVGALAQFIEVEPEYVTAVESALGANLQAVVMKDAAVAESAIKTLTAKKLGRASLALAECRVSGGERRADAALPDGAVGKLLDFVKTSDGAREFVEALLGEFLLVANLETALRISSTRNSQSDTRQLVTLAGEVVTCEGIVHGGAVGKAVNSVLQRKNQIAEIERDAKAVRAQVKEITARREAVAAAIEAAQAATESAREEKQNASLAVSQWRGQLGSLEREAREAERRQQNLQGERASSETRQREAAARLENLEKEIAASAEQIEALTAKRSEVQTQLEALRMQESEVSGDLNELRIKVATERQRHTSLHHQRQPMEARLAELEELLAQRRRDIESYERRGAAAETENAEIEANLERLHGETTAAEGEVSGLVGERGRMAARADEVGNELRILRTQMSAAHDQRSRLEVKHSQLEMKLTALGEHIQKRYQLDLQGFERDLHGLRVAIREQGKRASRGIDSAGLEAASTSMPQDDGSGERAAESNHERELADVEAAQDFRKSEVIEQAAAGRDSSTEAGSEAFDVDWERVEAMVREIDARIDAMGPVNIDAIQEYDELEERFAFLEKQNADLTNAKAELLGVIAKINQTTKSLFAETFEKIRVNFSEMFVELFGGGKANLLLVDDSDPLESGIDIIAKPPGKQLTSISLLSGGERTMTAVALLFSIYMVKPAPFCVLDEMDAPLDESNINRFIKILDRFVGQSQFVVISHNKRTIARADALYGVTMEEHGVSKLVGVKFSRRDESAEKNDVLGTNNLAPVRSVAEVFGKRGDLHSEALAATGTW